MSYKKLEIWEMARKVSIAVHKMTLTELPKFETVYDDLHKQLEILGEKLNLFIQAIERNQHPETSNK